jgi:hypothetical protein
VLRPASIAPIDQWRLLLRLHDRIDGRTALYIGLEQDSLIAD